MDDLLGTTDNESHNVEVPESETEETSSFMGNVSSDSDGLMLASHKVSNRLVNNDYKILKYNTGCLEIGSRSAEKRINKRGCQGWKRHNGQ
jgi:3-oxoacyl-[acyl-carrier-protein] synthase III